MIELKEPLEKEEELKALNDSAKGDRQAKEKLIEHNLKLVVHIASKYKSNVIDLDDLVSVGVFGLMKAVDSFSLDKNTKLATYASRCINNEIVMYLRKQKRALKEIPLESTVHTDSEGNKISLLDVLTEGDTTIEGVETSVDHAILRGSLEVLNPKELQVISMMFGLDGQEPMLQKQVANELGFSQAYISRIRMSALEKLRQEFIKQSNN